MNKSKKLTAAVAASAVASALVAPAAFAATTLTDIDGSFAKDAIKELVDKGIINGKGDGKFDPTGQIERQDFAIILAKALNLDVAAAPATATFSDVPTTHYSFKFVEAAVKAGLIKGNGDGTFGNGSNLSRQDMAALFVRALGTDVTGKGKDLKFSDAGEIADYAKDAVAAAVELGLISGNGDGTFNPNGNAERQAVALVASKFLKAKEAQVATLTGATVVDKNTVTLTFSKALEALKVEDVAVAAKASGAAVNVTAVTLSDDKKSATVKVTPLASGTTYTATVAGKAVEFTTAAKAEVSAVTALNLKQIKVEFSAAVDEVTATNLENYTLDGDIAALDGDKDSATLLEDGKTVIITLDNAATTRQFENQVSYELTVAGVTDANGTVVEEATKAFTAFDNVVPTAKEVTVVGPNSLKVTFSSPVKAAEYGDFSLDKGTVSTSVSATTNPANVGAIDGLEYSVVLNVGADLAEGEHELKVAGVDGFNGYSVASQTLKFNYAKDTVAPTVSVSSVKLASEAGSLVSKVTFKFSEPVLLDNNDLANSEVYAVYNGVGTATPLVKHALANVIESNGSRYADTFVATFDEVFPTGEIKFFVNNASEESVIEDAWGNAFNDAVVTGSHAIDTVKPVVNSVEYKAKDKKVVLTFSENLNQASAEDNENYVFLNSDGKPLTSAGFDNDGHPTYDINLVDNNKVEIDLAGLPVGDVTLKVANVKDAAAPVGNKLEPVSLKIAVADTVPPEVLSALRSVDGKTVWVNFNKEMNADSIKDVSNYQFGNLTFKDLADFEGVTVTAINNNKGIKITAKESLIAGGNVLKYGRLKDAKGNLTSSLTATKTVELDGVLTTDNNILNLRAVNGTTFTFEVKQQLSKVDTSKITFTYADGTEVTNLPASYTYTKVNGGTVDGTLVTLKLPTSSSTVKIYSDASNFGQIDFQSGALVNTNNAGNAFAFTLDTDATNEIDEKFAEKIAPTVAFEKKKEDNVDADANTATPAVSRLTQIDVTFSENVRVSTVSKDTFKVAGFDVADVVPATGYAGQGTFKTFKIVLVQHKWADINNTTSVTVQKDVEDANGNLLKASTKAFTPTSTWENN